MKSQQKTVRVLLVDDHPLMRKGLRVLIESEPDLTVIGEAEDGEAAIVQVKALTPDVVVMDISMPKLNGIEASKRILADVPGTRIIAMSIHVEKYFVDSMINAGTMGYVLKDSAPEELVNCIHSVIQGNVFLSASILGDVVSAYKKSINGSGDGFDEAAADYPDESEYLSTTQIRNTKLHRPQLPDDEVPRKILFSQLDTQRARQLTLVSAPAGFGKSILIASWLKHCDWPSVWLSLETDDSSLRQFLRYFLKAVQSHFALACQKSLELIEAPSMPSIDTLVTILSSELDAIEEPFILVLDDYHHIDSNSQVNTLLQKLIDASPIPFHLIIITRRDPPLSLMTLRANGQMTDIRMSDLRFKPEEIRLLIEKALPISVNDDIITNLDNELEGWAVGLRLVIFASRQMEKPLEFLKELHGGIQQIQEYLVQEVVQNMSPIFQEWLLKSAIFKRFNLSLCERVLSSTSNDQELVLDSEKFINTLNNENLFIIQLDPNGNWFRYHHLFQTLILNEMKQRYTVDEVAELHLRTSVWFEQHGSIDEAIHHALQSGNTTHAAQIVEKHYRDVLNQDKWYVLDEWLEMLPSDIRSQRAGLLLVQAATAFFRQQLPVLLQTVQALESICQDHSVSDEDRVELDLYSACLSFWESNIIQSEVEFETMVQRFSDRQQTLRTDAIGYLGFSRLMNGKQSLAIEELNAQILKAEQLDMVRLIGYLCLIELLAGNLYQLRLNVARMSEQSKRRSNQYLNSWNQYLAGISMLHVMELDAAERHFNSVIEHLYYIDARPAIDAMAGLAMTQQMLQKPQAADQTIQRMMQFAIELNDPEQIIIARSCEARIDLLRGNVTKAFSRISSLIEPLTSVNVFTLFSWFEVLEMTHVRGLLAEGSTDSLQQAVVLLEQMQEISESFHLNCQIIEITLLLTLAFDKQGMTGKAFLLFEQSLKLTEAGGWLRPFVEVFQASDFLQRFVQEKGDTPFLQSIRAISSQLTQSSVVSPVKHVSSKLNNVAKVNGLIETLTNRELDILQLLAQRFQNKEIARHLFVSTETVKTHLKHLYQKLGVNNRREAASLADEILKNNRSNS